MAIGQCPVVLNDYGAIDLISTFQNQFQSYQTKKNPVAVVHDDHKERDSYEVLVLDDFGDTCFCIFLYNFIQISFLFPLKEGTCYLLVSTYSLSKTFFNLISWLRLLLRLASRNTMSFRVFTAQTSVEDFSVIYTITLQTKES